MCEFLKLAWKRHRMYFCQRNEKSFQVQQLRIFFIFFFQAPKLSVRGQTLKSNGHTKENKTRDWFFLFSFSGES